MNQEIEQIILRNLSGEASCDDVITFSEWLASSARNKESFLKIKKYWDAEVAGAKLQNPEATYNKLLDRIRKAERKETVRRLWIRYAGAAAVAIIVGITGYWIGGQRNVTPVQYYSYITGNSVSSFELPDGTEISLNKNSTLSYSSSYGEKVREVSLEGEGYFSVTKDKTKAFVVDLNGSKISVLGTVFNVKNDSKENVTTATLVEGSIRFETPEQQILLKPNQQLVFNKSENQIDIENVSTDLITAWKSHLIKYKSISFKEFLDMLKDRYTVDIVLSNEILGEQKVTGSFDESLTVDQILDLMKKNLSFRWKKEGDKYVINK
ncbi:FecR domain-containing protein [Parabacteroides faecis]|uniref:FecR family protein n=1 Tax=Parabacteroides faecis TaxID=1217282 RepID=UPI00216403A1|nr:FecR domain-containing protein [Parabacteroides faecis]MCS2890400.1 FecR domain-containing protein [Parabacteroides faecis]UVQ45914.1 FecR domain-containing protein [Parabacteroides faecis]